MRPARLLATSALIALLALPAGAPRAEDETDDETLLLQNPTVSDEHVVFVYARDLWIAPRNGGDARRLTSSSGVETSPKLSPDGQWVAFTGQYDGNTDVYVISIDGGMPRRLTWHPDTDLVLDWHPDGKRILFSSGRASSTPVQRAFLVNVHGGGTPRPLELPRVAHASYDEDATRLAYTQVRDAFRSWKRYRGGRTPAVWVYDPTTHEVEEVPHENASDTFPVWLDGHVFFASDRDGRMNLWRYRPGSGEVHQVTRFTDFDIRHMDAGGGVIVFEQAGALHLYDPKREATKRLRIRCRTDGLHAVPRWETVRGAVRSADISPNGMRIAIEARGEIITSPRENGRNRNLTNSPGAHDRSPAWSPDGKRLAWLSDGSGEYRLLVTDHLGREEPKSYELGNGGFYHDLQWSPDGKHILFNDKTNRIAYVTLETGAVTDVARLKGSLGVVHPTARWSPDSQWIAFEHRNPETIYDSIALFEVKTAKVTRITDDFGSADSPAFSTDGKYLFFHASVESGPRRFGLDMSTSAARSSDGNLYVVVLKKDEPDPLMPKTDEAVIEAEAKRDAQKPKEEEKKDEEDKKDPDEDPDKKDDDDPDKKDPDDPDKKDDDDPDKKDGGESDDDEKKDDDDKKGDDEKKDEEPTETPPRELTPHEKAVAAAAAARKAKEAKANEPSIDLDGIDQRILALPIGSGDYRALQCIKDKLLFLSGSGAAELQSFDFDSRKANGLIKGVRAYGVSGNHRWLLVFHGNEWATYAINGKGRKKVFIDGSKVRVDPAREWPQILREVWRIERDYFYDPAMHGVDWPAMWERWSAFLPHVRHRADLNMLISEMIGELACGHEYVSGGQEPDAPTGVDVGLLGADYEVDSGRYRIAKIYRGQNWNPGLRAPLTGPGVDVREGDYLIAVNGREVTAKDNIYEAFEYTADQRVELTLASDPVDTQTRTVTVVTIGNEHALRQRSWVEENRRRVDELSGGRLAYIYMPNTGGAGMAAFDRDFYSQLGKEGLVIDERFNGGGKVADYVIEVLSRKVLCFWMNREQWLARTPFGTFEGPKVMIINERAGSGGDAMPWLFKKQGLGKLVGRRTWGGLVGISGYPELMDGGRVTAASFGVMDADGEWAVENVGVAPDIDVVQWPKEVIAGRDPQLEAAVKACLEELAKTEPRKTPKYYPPEKR